MRGFNWRSEALRSHFLCTSCRQQIIAERSFNGSRFLHLSPTTRLSADNASIVTPTPEIPPRPSQWNLQAEIQARSLAARSGRHGTSPPGSSATFADSEESARQREVAFYRVLQDAQPDQVMETLLDPRNAPFVQTMPDDAFASALLLLSPEHFVHPYRDLHAPLHPRTVQVKGYRTLEEIIAIFTQKLRAIVDLRRETRGIGLVEYNHLLRCAASMGNGKMASTVWAQMEADHVEPNLESYNHLLESLVWDGALTGLERHRLRVSPFYYRKRRFYDTSPGFQGFGTGARSVRKQVQDVFNRMASRGIHGDASTFIHLFLASARVGYVIGMKAVLKTAWNLDVDQLLRDPGQHPPLIEYDRSSPYFPTEDLLFAIAHGFGVNSNMTAAFQTIDFFSKQYQIDIPERVWIELFRRAYVLSKRRFGPDADRMAKGSVPRMILSGIVELMSSEPHKVQPTVEIYRMLARNAYDKQRLGEFGRHIEDAFKVWRRTRERRREARKKVEQHLGAPLTALVTQPPSRTTLDAAMQSPRFWHAMYEYDLAWLEFIQQTILMEKIVRLGLIQPRWPGKTWGYRVLPRFLAEWKDFAPQQYSFTTGDRRGTVQIHGASTWDHENLRTHQNVPMRWSLDGERPAEGEEVEPEDAFLWEKLLSSSATREYMAREPFRSLLWRHRATATDKLLLAEEARSQSGEGIQERRRELLRQRGLPAPQSIETYTMSMTRIYPPPSASSS